MPSAPWRLARGAGRSEVLLAKEIDRKSGVVLGQANTARSPFASTAVTALVGSFIGYLADAEDFTAGVHAATLVPRIRQVPPDSSTLDGALVPRALALIESLER